MPTVHVCAFQYPTAIAWCLADEPNPAVDATLDRVGADGAAVPALWPFELANGLAIAERRGRLTAAGRARIWNFLEQFEIEIEPATLAHVLGKVLPLAREHQLTVYDAAYLELAARRSLPLATLDERLRRAATQTGVTLLGPS